MKKRILYFGLDPVRYRADGELVHLPLIWIKPRSFESVKHYFALPHASVLFTSQVAVSYYFKYTDARDKIFICIGEATAERLAHFQIEADHVAKKACGEGIIALLKTVSVGYILYPHSAKARRLIPNYLKQKERGTSFSLYDTFFTKVSLPDLNAFDRLVFTSPSTVEAFFALSSTRPAREKCEAIGLITENALNKLFNSSILPSKC